MNNIRLNHAYTLLGFLLLFGCDSDQDRDCRNDGLGCTAGYDCKRSDSGDYLCLEAAPTHDSSLPEMGDARVGGAVSSDAATTIVDAGVSQQTDAQSTPDMAEPSASDMGTLFDTGLLPQPEDSTMLKNFPDDCQRVGLVGPVLPNEANHHAAVILTPPTYPFGVERVLYDLVTGEDSPTCTGVLAHEVELIVIDGLTTPPASPSTEAVRYRSYTVDASPTASSGRIIDLTLPTTLILEAGQHLVISVELAAENGRHLCLSRCEDTDAVSGTEWWSNTPDAPYRWQDLIDDFGFKGVMMSRALGAPL